MPGEEPLLIETGKGRTLLWKGLSFYPSGNPLEYARRKARVFSPPPGSLVFVPSVGLGHGLAELLQRLPEGCAVLCLEAFQEVMAIALAQELPGDPRLSIVRTADPAGAAAALDSLGIHRFRRVVELPLSAGYRLAPELYAQCRRRLEEEIRRYWQNRLTLIALGSLQVSNLLLNLSLLPGAHDLSSLSTSLPVVVAGAGPSLEECIPSLTRLRRSFVLAAVDTAFPALAAHGIFPDVVVALEAQVANMQDFIPFRSNRTILACDLSSHPSVNRLFNDRLYYFSSRFAPLRLFDRLARAHLHPTLFPALGSVGVAAVHAGLQIGRGDVFLTGLDLSFPGSRTHVRGAPSHLAMLNGSTRLMPIGQDAFQALAARSLLHAPDKRGGTITTDRVLKSYRDNIESVVKDSETRVMDFGPQGLDLGVRRISMGEWEERIACGSSPAALLEIDSRKVFPRDRIHEFMQNERDLLARAIEALRKSTAEGGASEECRTLLREIDYVWVQFPDPPGLESPDRSFLSRARVAAGHYARRLDRIASIL
ncbi:MAG: 6-hydroxymethylpterin diphosphokinase MptE-like protein [Spirochaetia bacterium]|jgi:hypothetical protein